jgi:hypothetical protein
MFLYFRKDNAEFSHIGESESSDVWLDSFYVENYDSAYTYKLVDGIPEIDKLRIISDSYLPNIEELELNALRELRNKKLLETDWWGTSDRVMTQAQIDYRQALRDITNFHNKIKGSVWPVYSEPEVVAE